MVQGAKSIILNNSYKIYCVKCPWFWFWLNFVPYTTRAVFCSIDETLDVWLPPWFATSNSALKSNSLKKNSNLCLTYSNICHSQLKYQMKNFWLKASVLYEQLLSRVLYTTFCPIGNSMFVIFV